MDKIKFDRTCMMWDPNSMYNKVYLKAIEDQLNDLIKIRGYVTLYDVYRQLHIDCNYTQACEFMKVAWFAADHDTINIYDIVDVIY